ncbi:MAG: hypothetical protein ETSY2_32620 [Candidatus Entotheonella gemina]|uniref:EthD domain-containing protein n=2 Tax=Candidatus Entotheonella TaxID=93171 RepID=W4M0R7_9BACT|nr:MAG: hypothetical protein ETSY2_32620 [Candidatus Entotheonella gemina]
MTRPQGLLAIWSDIDADYTPAFIQWHNCEHIPERVNIPGFHVGHRYRALDDARDFFMVYETETAEVMQSEPYLHSQNHPTPWTRQSVSHFRDPLRTIYTLVAQNGDQPALDAPYLLLVRSNPPERPDGEGETLQWYATEHLPRLGAVEGVHRARLYRAEPDISNLMTAERQVHGAASGSQRFLAMYEMSAPDIPNSGAWQEAARGTDWSANMVASLRDVERERYWLDFALWAPSRR